MRSSMGSLPRHRRASAPAVLLTVVLVAASAAAFGVTRNVVKDNERRLLKERADEATMLLQRLILSSTPTLGVLAMLATPQDGATFEQGARVLANAPGATVALLVEEKEGAFTVAAAVGESLVPSQTIAGERASIAARALAGRDPVIDLVKDGGRTLFAHAVAAPHPSGAVAVLETVLDPQRPLPSSPGTAFSDVRAALYASPTVDPSRLVLTTERRLPVQGRVVNTSFELGGERWTLVVGSRAPLSGAFPATAPWALLVAGLLTAVLAGAIVQTLARRQMFATALVDDRTDELESTRKFLQRLLASSLTVVMRADLSDPERRATYVSPNVRRVLGLDPDDVVRQGGFEPFVHPGDVETARAATQPPMVGDPPIGVREFRIRHGDDSYRWVSAISVLEVDEDARAPGMFVHLTDVSDRRQAESALRVAQEAAEAANRSKSEFLSRMSHELRTPLNAVLGFGQLLERTPLTDMQTEAVDQILSGGRHLLDLINEVLDIARIESGRLPLSPEAVLVSEVVRESIDLVRPLAQQRMITLFAEERGMSCYVFADRQRLKQVLLNLLSNAVKYNRLRGLVRVSCSEDGDAGLRISVGDTGPGIRPEQMDRLFTPFDRLDAAQSDIEGTGIGLALSKSLTEAMGGALTVDSVVGEGSTFSIHLPRVEGPVERYERALPRPGSRRSAGAGGDEGARHKILYIEDNLSNLKLIERVLAGRGDIELVSAMQGRLGMELARQHQPRMILLDLHLPDLTGEHVLRRLRDDDATASIPVVMVSADATTGQVQRLLSAGATAYLTKPLEVAKLLSVVDDVLAVP